MEYLIILLTTVMAWTVGAVSMNLHLLQRCRTSHQEARRAQQRYGQLLKEKREQFLLDDDYYRTQVSDQEREINDLKLELQESQAQCRRKSALLHAALSQLNVLEATVRIHRHAQADEPTVLLYQGD